MKTKLIIAVACIFATIGCERKKNANQKQAEATNHMMAEAERQIGMPAITNWQERKLMKSILELRDQEDLVTYAYIVNLEGELVYLGRCVGFGLPYSVQFTNPVTLQKYNVHGGYVREVVPQPDPNGLYMPEGLAATWLMMLDENSGSVRPVYVEPEIIVSPFPLH